MPRGAFRNPFTRTSQLARIVVVIPARYASSRLPGKPLADIAGQPMIAHVYRRAARAPGVDAVVVATDDERVAAAVERFGGIVQTTSPAHRSGTDRVAEAVRDLACEIVVNVQGDLPLIEPAMIGDVIEPLARDAAVPMSTLRRAITDESDYHSPHVVKVVVDRHEDALYFSRAPIPHVRAGGAPDGGIGTGTRHDTDVRRSAASVLPATAPTQGGPYKHIGLYAYRRDFLVTFAALPQTPLEQLESLEQLRALEHGYRIRTVETRHESIEVDTPDDLERVRRSLAVMRA